MELPLNQIKFSDPTNPDFKLHPDLFDRIAKETAECIAQATNNKSTQLRKYYDELSMWEQKIRQITEKKKANEYYKSNLPLIKMINAKVTYAHGRKLVDDNFLKLMRHCLNELNESSDKETFKSCKLFFEAFMGFYKYEESIKENKKGNH